MTGIGIWLYGLSETACRKSPGAVASSPSISSALDTVPPLVVMASSSAKQARPQGQPSRVQAQRSLRRRLRPGRNRREHPDGAEKPVWDACNLQPRRRPPDSWQQCHIHVSAVAFAGDPVPPVMFSGLMPINASQLPVFFMCRAEGSEPPQFAQGQAKFGEELLVHHSVVVRGGMEDMGSDS